MQEVSVYGRVNGVDRTDRPIEADYITGSLLNISPAEHAGNEGKFFQYGTSGIYADSGVLQIMFQTPNYDDEYIHAYFEFFSTYSCTLQIYENGDRVGTTESSVLCLNRANPYTGENNMKVFTAWTNGTTDGTLIIQVVNGAGKIGGTSVTEPQWVLKKNAKYIVRITSGANNNNMGWSCFWWIQKHLWGDSQG